MVVDGQWVRTKEETERHEADALHAYVKARKDFQLVKADLEAIERRMIYMADLLRETRESDDILHGPVVKVLSLPADTYGDSQSLASIKAIAQALVVARKQLADAYQRANDFGVAI